MSQKSSKVVLVDDLIEAILNLPDSPNGYSASYSKADFLDLVDDLPKKTIKFGNEPKKGK